MARATKWLLPLAMVLGASCVDLKAMLSLQRDLQQRFGQQANINLNNGNVLSVTFVNVPESAVPAEDRHVFADSVAVFVRSHYPGFDSLNTLYVGFMRVRGGGGFTIRNVDASYGYRPADLAARLPMGSPSTATAVKQVAR